MKKHLETKINWQGAEEFHQELRKDCKHFNRVHQGGCNIGYMYCLDCDCPVPISMVIEAILKRLAWYLLPDESKKQ